jgi:hypothetical protein
MSIATLPAMEHTFTIDVRGTDTGQQFQGTFTYKRPNLRSKSNAAKLAARLNEDLKNLDDDTKLLHSILAELRFSLVQFPEWWQKSDFGLELYDANVIFDVYRACVDFENAWTDKVWGNQEAAKEELQNTVKKEKDEAKKKEK